MKNMKKLLLSCMFLIITNIALGQCSIDYNYYPLSANYGLDPDSLPNGYVGQFYNEDMTFFLPLDTVDSGLSVDFEDFHITSISLPLGLTWECNNSANSCHYNPSATQYGCVNISGNALIPGNYSVQVDLIATHSLSALAGSENISFVLPLNIIPDTTTSSNDGFAMTNSSGCSPVTISFTNNNVGMLSYFWDFGNGNTSSMSQPADQIYTQPGQYIVQYSAMQSSAAYFLQSIDVISGDCSDIIGQGETDFFYTLSSTSTVLAQVNSEDYITQDFPLIINNLNNAELDGQELTLALYDNDDLWWGSSTEDCGSLSFVPIQQAGTHSSNGGGLTIDYTVIEVPANTVVSSDTIYVYGYPDVDNLVYDTLENMIYTSQDSVSMQWYYYDSPIPGATDSFVFPIYSGTYSLLVVNQDGCSSFSEDVLVVICDSEYQPILDDNGSTAWMLDSALYTNIQWYNDNGLISGANQSFVPAQAAGWHYLIVTDEFGCTYTSESVLLSPFMNSSSLYSSTGFKIGPNPIANGQALIVQLENEEFSKVTIEIFDLFGRKIIHKVVDSGSSTFQINSSDIGKLSSGMYYLNMSFKDHKISAKIFKNTN
jgi:PKD repeat protein